MRKSITVCAAAVTLWASAFPGAAQETQGSATENLATLAPTEGLLSSAELQKLVAPVALYPDTVLVQVLIAATVPLDVIKADRMLRDNPELPVADLEQKIKAAAFDPSVEVLAIAFPELVREMAVHIDWTEAAGNAMIAQSDDVLAAVQVMRAQAINSGALVSSPEQVVSTDPKTSAVIVQPADPAIVYVPQYDPTVVYQNPVGDALATGLVVFGTIALIDEIFDDDDGWNNYWGCHNCGGWDDGPIIRNPDIDIDINGDVNIGNSVKIGGGWKPENTRVIAAREQIAVQRAHGGGTVPGLERPANRASELRSRLGAAADPRAAVSAQNRAGVDRATALGDRTSRAAAVRAPQAKAKPEPATKARAKPKGDRAKPKIAKTKSTSRTKDASRRGAVVIEGSGRRRR